MKKTYLFAILSIFVLIPCFSACQTELPISEMAEAHKAVRIAKALKADKYAPELFKKAEDNLYNSHMACRDDKIEDAKKFAVAAKNDAEEASKASWPLLAADTLKDAQNMYTEAENLGAVNTAPTQMNSAAGKIKRAETLHVGSSYNLSYVESLSAMRDIEEAKSQTILSQITALRKEATDIKNDADAVSLLADITSAETLLNSAETNLNAKNTQTALEQTNEAKEKITALQAALLKAKNDAPALASSQEIKPEQQVTEPPKDDKLAAKPAEKPAEKAKQTDKKVRIYIVQYIPKKRDCLWRIAQKMYQDPTLWPRIYIANRDKIKDPDLIFPGQRLVIPEISDAVKKASAKRAARVTQQKNTKPKSEAIRKGASKPSTKRPVTPGNAGRGKQESGKKNELTDRKPSDSTKIPSGSGTAGGDIFLPEGIFRENQ